MVRQWGRIAAVMALVVTAVVTATPAHAAPGSATPAVRAQFGEQTFTMTDGWGAARSCVVFSRAKVQCFASYPEADAALGRPEAAAGAGLAAVPSCTSGWLCLYADPGGQGRRLQFRDEYWNYLSAYGFDRQTSSWRNNQGSGDTGYLSLYNRDTTYPCTAGSYALTMGSYDNQAYAVWG